MSETMNDGLKPAHEVIMRHLEEQAELIERERALGALDVAFGRYSKLCALLAVLEEMVIPDAVFEDMLFALAGLSSRLKKWLPTAPAFHARADKTGERLGERLVCMRAKAIAAKAAAEVAPTSTVVDGKFTEETGSDGIEEDGEDGF